MKTLYLHIGTPKTATTSIQSFCYQNREILEKQGFYYPMFDYHFQNIQPYRNAHFLICRVRDENERAIVEQQECITYEGIHRVQQLFEVHDKIILSDEGIWNRGFIKDADCWTKIQKEFVEKGIEVKVIVYLRRQDDFLYSWWNQQIKEGMAKYSKWTWQDVLREKPYIQLDYFEMLQKISEYVGKGNIIVRRFQVNDFVGGRIEKDFLNVLGIVDTEAFIYEDSVRNISLTKNMAAIKRILNTMPELQQSENRVFRNIATQLSAEVGNDRNSSMFFKEEAENFLMQYVDGNDRIAKEYMNQEDILFSRTVEEKDTWDRSNPEMMQDVIRFFGTTTLYLLNQNEELRQRVESQEHHIEHIRYKLKHPFRWFVQKINKKV